jgi:signal transduction histidine kinase
MTDGGRGNLRHALRVAAAATAVVALVYLVVVVVFDAVVLHRQWAQIDERLAVALDQAGRHPGEVPAPERGPHLPLAAPVGADRDDAPVFVWVVDHSGAVTAASVGAPSLPPGSFSRAGGYTDATVGASQFRLDARPYGDGVLVAGVSAAEQHHLESLLVIAEVVAGPIALLGMFLVSLVIGIQASAPVERARLRQLEFTADASHELRTPLSVIEAEIDLALSTRREAGSYRQTLLRLREESKRLQHIVEDLLWLARFDAGPPPPAREPIDLATIAEVCVARFEPLARSRQVGITNEMRGDERPWVHAPAEWIDRLAGILVDNACRYSPPGGRVLVAVEAANGRVSLRVEDSGPGIPAEERPRLFDRFHRATAAPGGTGLGLAIADSIVRSTDGRWRIGDSTLGGALMEVTWHRPHDRSRDAPPGVVDRQPEAHLVPSARRRGDVPDAGTARPASDAGTARPASEAAPGPLR